MLNGKITVPLLSPLASLHTALLNATAGRLYDCQKRPLKAVVAVEACEEHHR